MGDLQQLLTELQIDVASFSQMPAVMSPHEVTAFLTHVGRVMEETQTLAMAGLKRGLQGAAAVEQLQQLAGVQALERCLQRRCAPQQRLGFEALARAATLSSK